MNRISTLICIILSLSIGGCVTMGGNTSAEKRQSVFTMKNEVLLDLYKLKPDVKAQISSAPGYAVFSNVNINIICQFRWRIWCSQNNKSGKHTL